MKLNSDVSKKKRLLSWTFPEKIQISENKCRTEKMNRALSLTKAIVAIQSLAYILAREKM